MTNFKKAFYGLNKTNSTELNTIINNVDTLNDNLESYITETELGTALEDYVETTTLTTFSNRTLIQRWNLTPKEGTDTALATTGLDLKTGATYSCKFVADVAMTIVGMVSYVTEAYVYNTTDAKIELKTEASTPVVKVTYTFPQEGRDAKTTITTTPTSATLAAGDALDIVVTATGAGGAGHVKLYLLYTVD